MKRLNIFTVIIMLLPCGLYSKPLINEISAGGSSDWVEITLSGDTPSWDISHCFVTMYYGSNEKLSDSPVTLRDSDNPSTPYDDRFAVIHFTPLPVADETDSTGDTNMNGILDIYCCNYGLWNTDCVVSIDSDDLPANGGITDFAAFSNRDGSMNSTISGYIESAVSAGEWSSCAGQNPQECAVDIGSDGLAAGSTISRISGPDTNSAGDFTVTKYSTPGRVNITSAGKKGRRLFRALKKKKAHISGSGDISMPLFLYETCSLKLRIFNSTGFLIYSSDLKTDLYPGFYTFNIPEKSLRGRVMTGLYPVRIEAAGKNSSSETSLIYLVISGRKK